MTAVNMGQYKTPWPASTASGNREGADAWVAGLRAKVRYDEFWRIGTPRAEPAGQLTFDDLLHDLRSPERPR